MGLAANLSNLFGSFLLFRRWRRTYPHRSSLNPATPRADSLPTPTPSERRRGQRRYGNPIQVLIAGSPAGENPARGWVVDRSAGGLGLSSAQPVAKGTVLNVRVTTAPDTVPWVSVEVKESHPLAGRWILNCQFVHRPPQEALLLFR